MRLRILSRTSLRPAWAPVVEAAGLLLAATLWLLLANRVLTATIVLRYPSLSLFTVLLGLVLADVVSGLVHWFCDTFFEETTPLIGSMMIAPFREHHRDPLAMTRHGFLELNGNNGIALVPVLGTAWWFGPVEVDSEGTIFCYSVLLSFALTITATNQFHRWAHDPAPPRIARLLHGCGLALKPWHHARHHAPPHRSAYCVTTGWSNPVADRLGVFTRAERLLTALGLPRSGSRESHRG